jgi:hypothetical protein
MRNRTRTATSVWPMANEMSHQLNRFSYVIGFDPSSPKTLTSRWMKVAERVSSITALGILAFVFLADTISQLKITGELRDLVLFVSGSLLLPPVCAAIRLKISRMGAKGSAFETAYIWLAAALVFALAALPVVLHFFSGGAPLFLKSAHTVTFVAFGTLIIGAAILGATNVSHLSGWLHSKSTAVNAFAAAISVALLSLFWMQPEQRFFNPIVRFFAAPPFIGTGALSHLAPALSIAVLGILLIVFLARLEIQLGDRGADYLPTMRKAGLLITVGLTCCCFFDFSLPSDAIHYLTNVAPALHVRFGGVVMVDTFSQYGPGPVLMTLLGLNLGPTTLATANIIVQIHNLAFYSLWIFCLYRLSALKLPALVIGFLSVGVLMAGWGGGNSNINFAPSILGFRYLPILLMVVAISLMPPPKHHSAFTAVSTFIAGLWGIEALVGALGIHLVFLAFLNLRHRAFARVFTDSVKACLPFLAAIAVTISLTLIQSGKLPNYAIYMEYLSVYSMLSPYWSLPANPLFFGWAAILIAVFLVLADSWTRIIDQSSQITELSVSELIYKFVPMAFLAVLMSAYFVGRSVEYTIVLAFLPFVGIAAPAILRTATYAVQTRAPAAWYVLSATGLACLWALSFTLLALLRHDAPYSFFLQECRDQGRCIPSALLAGLHTKLLAQPVIEKVGNRWSDNYYDGSGAVREAVDAIQRFAPDQPTVSVFLGPIRGIIEMGTVRDQIASDVALMYAGKWHRWPRSYGFSDELLPALVTQIVTAPIHLNAGELVIVRRDETKFGEIEKGILQKIRSENTLCPLPEQWKEIAAYRIADKASCPAQ